MAIGLTEIAITLSGYGSIKGVEWCPCIDHSQDCHLLDGVT